MSDNHSSQAKPTVAESHPKVIKPKPTVAESNLEGVKPKPTVAESNSKAIKPKPTETEGIMRPHRTPFVREDPLAGKTIGDNNRYLLQTLLGQGGMSKVYQALDTKFENRIVAIKLMTNYANNNQHLIKRFMAEVKAVSSLKHPNVIQIFDFGITPNQPPFFGVPFYVMEHLEGYTLQDLLSQNQPQSWHSVLKIVRQVCAGLKEAHNKGIVHRDLKPENIFLVTGGALGEIVRIIDFGIAKNTNANVKNSTQLTREGSFLGTYRYASPEQCRGLLNIDRRSDIYSLGVILYEALSGQNPYSSQEDLDISQADWIVYHIKGSPRPIEEQPGCEHLEAKFQYIVMKCLAKSPEDRFASIEELQQAFADNFVTVRPEEEETQNLVSLQDTKLIGGQKQQDTPSATVEIAWHPSNEKDEDTEIDVNPALFASGYESDPGENRSVNSKIEQIKNKLSPKLIASAVVIALVCLGTGSYLISSNNNTDPNSTAKDTASTATTEEPESTVGDRDLTFVAQSLENQYLKQNYQECYQSALKHSERDNHLIANWLGKCGLEAAKTQANASSFSGAIAIASKIPTTVPNYQEVKTSINTWSENILNYATSVYKKGELEQAIKITNAIPKSTATKAKIPDLIAQWKQQQASHQATIQQAQDLLNRGQWADAKREVEKIPSDFVFWRAEAQPILDRANQKIAEIVAAEKARQERERAAEIIPAPLRDRLKDVPLLNDELIRRRLGN